jgi:site-specific recombinase XerC
VLFSLIYRGLKIAEITALTFESVKFSNKTGICSIVAKPSRGGSRGRRVDLTNDEMIILEDWLDHRGDKSGALLSTVVKNKVEGKRLTTALLKTICEERAEKAKVPEFAPNDLSRSAEALESHRKSAKRKAARAAQENMSSAEKALYLASSETDADTDTLNEAIQFPFLGLNI